MKAFAFAVTALLAGFVSQAQTTIPSKDMQIRTAVLAAPEDKRENSTVLGYNEQGELITLREGSNEIICLADDPNKPGLNVAAYHKDLEPFMKRGRDLRASGKSGKELTEQRDEEVKAGKLKMPEQPSSLYVYTATPENYNTTTGEVKDGFLRYVIYIANATSASTGLPEKPDAAGMPWIMDPGTPRAHIMITPPKN